jgi:hypothetical protein
MQLRHDNEDNDWSQMSVTRMRCIFRFTELAADWAFSGFQSISVAWAKGNTLYDCPEEQHPARSCPQPGINDSRLFVSVDMYPAENRQVTSTKQKRDLRQIFACGFCGLFHRKSKSPASPSTTTPHAGTNAAGSQVQIDVQKPEATVKEAITESRELPHRKPPTYPEPWLQVPGTIGLEAPESRRSSVSFAPTYGDKKNS